MLSKLVRPVQQWRNGGVLLRGPKSVLKQPKKQSHFIPPSQYDLPWPNNLKPLHVMIHNWECIPLFLSTGFSFVLLFGYIAWSCLNKVDIVFTTHNRCNISRTMDLRCPSVHKLIIINQRYEPWEEMQNSLERMREVDKKLSKAVRSCQVAPKIGIN